MKRAIALTIAMLVIIVPSNTVSGMTIQKMNLRPMAFTENSGQWDDRVKFRSNAGGATMWFTEDGVYYQFTRRIPSEEPFGAPPKESGTDSARWDDRDHSGEFEQLTIKAEFIGANTNPEIIGEEMMEYRCNYFIGNDPDKWYTDVSNYSSVVFKDVYAGIDLKYYGNGKQMEYDFIVSPGADPSQIMVHYDGAKSISVNDRGELIVETQWGMVTEMRPFVYQLDALGPILVEGEYVLFPGNRFGFELDSSYDPELAVVIDPVLSYSTYLGGSNNENSYDIGVDDSGCAYVTGSTSSADFPAVGEYQAYNDGGDVFVTKLSSSGDNLVYSTFLGGSITDVAFCIALDDLGCAYVAGSTYSTDFPTKNAYQPYGGSYLTAFVTKLGSAGDSLVFSTYLGEGSGGTRISSIAVDDSEFAYVTGNTGITDFPTKGEYQSDQPGEDAFVTKLNTSGDDLVYSTYLGGSDGDYGRDIEVDALGQAYVVGFTYSPDFPTLNPYQADQGALDGFVTKLNSEGNGLIYSTYLGGDGYEGALRIAVDNTGHAYVTGYTESENFPTKNAFQDSLAGGFTLPSDAFATKIASSGDSLIYSTYIGGSDEDAGYGIAIDAAGSACIAGSTASTDFPTKGEYQSDQGQNDVFVARLSKAGDALVYGTYLGGDLTDGGSWHCGFRVDDAGNAYVTWVTWSSNFPTHESPVFLENQGGSDAFVTKLGCYVCGDVNASGDVDIDDIMYLIAYMFTGGPEPIPYESGDVNCSGEIDIDDIMYLIAYMFTGGPAPCNPDGDGEPDC